MIPGAPIGPAPPAVALPAAVIDQIVALVGFAVRDALRALSVTDAAAQPLQREVASPDARMRTPERKQLIRREWPLGTPITELTAQVNALPGLPMDKERIGVWASKMQLRRPEKSNAAKPAPVEAATSSVVPQPPAQRPDATPAPIPAADTRCRTPERKNLLRETYEAGVIWDEIERQINLLPGRFFPKSKMSVWACQMKLRRPAPQPAPALQRLPEPTQDVPSPAAAKPLPVPPPKQPPKIAAYVPPPPRPALPPEKTPAQIKRDAEAALVAAHVAKHGVTKCPSAVAIETTAVRNVEDAAAIKAYTDQRNAAAQDEIMKRVENNKRSRAAKLRGEIPKGRAHG